MMGVKMGSVLGVTFCLLQQQQEPLLGQWKDGRMVERWAAWWGDSKVGKMDGKTVVQLAALRVR